MLADNFKRSILSFQYNIHHFILYLNMMVNRIEMCETNFESRPLCYALGDAFVHLHTSPEDKLIHSVQTTIA